MIAMESSRIIAIALRSVQAIFALIVLATGASVISWWKTYWHASSPSPVAFLVFSAVWTLLAVTFLCIVPWRLGDSRLNHRYVILGLETVTMIFWFAGFIASARFIGDRWCSGHACSAAKAATVFAAFEWALFAGSMAMGILEVIRARAHVSPTAKSEAGREMSESV